MPRSVKIEHLETATRHPPFGKCAICAHPELLADIVDEAFVVGDQYDSAHPDFQSLHESVPAFRGKLAEASCIYEI